MSEDQPSAAPEPRKQEKKDPIQEDLLKMSDTFVKTMSDLGLQCVVIVHGVLDNRIRRIYHTNLTQKADRIVMFETMLRVEQSEGVQMPARHPLAIG